MAYEQKPNEANFFRNSDVNIIGKATVEIDGVNRYGMVVQSKTADGNNRFEFMMSAGLIYENSDKQSPKSPDMSGPITIDGEEYRLRAWINEGQNSGEYLHIKFEKKEAPEAPF